MRDRNLRHGIRFHLVPADAATNETVGADVEDVEDDGPTSMADLRQRALDAATATSERKTGDAARSYYARSRTVARYVLARAAGVCESCREPAPFKRRNGTPYLEPHHTRRRADNGPDHPKWVGAICPTCHRRIHHGADGAQVNAELMTRIAALEESTGAIETRLARESF